MATCELLEHCPFFHDRMANMPMVSEILKQRFCLGTFPECARYRVRQAGLEMPRELFPDDNQRALELIEGTSAQREVGALVAGVGASSLEDPEAAGRQAAEAAMPELGEERPKLVIVYASPHGDLSALLAGVRSVTKDAPLIGATGVGHFHNGVASEPGWSGTTVLVLGGGQYTFGVGAVTDISADLFTAGRTLAASAVEAAVLGGGSRRCDGTPSASPRPHSARTVAGIRAAKTAATLSGRGNGAMVVLTTGLSGDPEFLLNGIYRITGQGVPIVGGIVENPILGGTQVFCNDQVLTDAAVAVWISAPHPIRVACVHGWRPVGAPMAVTEVDGLCIQTVSGRPAQQVLAEIAMPEGQVGPAGQPGEQTEPAQGTRLGAFGLIEPDGSRAIRVHVAADDGCVHSLLPVPLYSAVQVMTATPEDLLAVCDGIPVGAGVGEDSAVLLAFSCVIRMESINGRGAAEATRLQEAAGPVATFGLYTYGEFARVSGGGVHNAMIAAIAL